MLPYAGPNLSSGNLWCIVQCWKFIKDWLQWYQGATRQCPIESASKSHILHHSNNEIFNWWQSFKCRSHYITPISSQTLSCGPWRAKPQNVIQSNESFAQSLAALSPVTPQQWCNMSSSSCQRHRWLQQSRHKNLSSYWKSTGPERIGQCCILRQSGNSMIVQGAANWIVCYQLSPASCYI